jgi:hypothetical protein
MDLFCLLEGSCREPDRGTVPTDWSRPMTPDNKMQNGILDCILEQKETQVEKLVKYE